MGNMLIYPVGSTAACRYAVSFLARAGIEIVDHPTPDVTHVLLDVPSFASDGTLRGGGDLASILAMLPSKVVVIGGNLKHEALEQYQTMDLLQIPSYLAKNAAITADCALRVAAPLMTTTFLHSPTLIIGWGRIGKCLGHLLRSIGTDVTIAARKTSDRALIQALGYQALNTEEITTALPQFRLLFNTAPELILNKKQLSLCRNCVKVDLASKPGLEADDVIWARGLPGVHTPESSGQLIADTILTCQGR